MSLKRKEIFELGDFRLDVDDIQPNLKTGTKTVVNWQGFSGSRAPGPAPRPSGFERLMDAISKALAIDPNISDAHSALCHNRNRYEYDTDRADAACTHFVQAFIGGTVIHLCKAPSRSQRSAGIPMSKLLKDQ
jgi:hypothetical protein